MRVGMIGLGNMGTAVGNLIAANGYEVLGWNYEQEVVDEININHSNDRFLPDIPLHGSLRATKDLARGRQGMWSGFYFDPFCVY